MPTDLTATGIAAPAIGASRTQANRRWIGRRGWLAIGLVVIAVNVCLVAGTGFRYRTLRPASAVSAGASDPQVAASARESRRLATELGGLGPRGHYIVVDRANNRLYLRQGDKTVLDAVCSSGSGAILNDPNGDRQWIFDTPSGVFRVLSKTKNPAWRKPDWAFVEEGRPVPGNPGERIEYGTLGEFALHFGNGYLIHGTLYERLLGRSVTHGCVRLGAEDLRKVYQAAPLGTPVYIF